MTRKRAVIIGAGPAGLTAAYELLTKTDIEPIVLEMSGDIGGISKTINYKGNRIDIGGHRFFSKSGRVMDWWQTMMPLQTMPARDDILTGRTVPATGKDDADPEEVNRVLLIRERLSRIFFLRKFFNYPITLNWSTFINLGSVRLWKIAWSYILIKIRPISEEKSLEEFLINRFGKELYRTFFKDYTEKVWGVTCSDIPADWGAQRIKGLSVKTTLKHAIKSLVRKDQSIEQKNTETSLIGQFLYPKYGPGQLWEEVARKVQAEGGTILMHHQATTIDLKDNSAKSVTVKDHRHESELRIQCDYLISTMPVKELIEGMGADVVPGHVQDIAAGLIYRDFITVGLLLKKVLLKNNTRTQTMNDIVPDNWIYIQESDVKIGRLQIFNNWSPYLVEDSSNIWLGLEYFCNEGDELWSKEDEKFIEFAIQELETIGIIHGEDVLDATIIRIPKTYPAYFGSYNRFNELRKYTDSIENLYLIGRNGMHRYNNADHSMLTAMAAVENIRSGITSKDNIWAVNTEQDYHEAKAEPELRN